MAGRPASNVARSSTFRSTKATSLGIVLPPHEINDPDTTLQ